MAAPKDRFWAKVLFKEFIRHYRKLSEDEIVRDVKQSMDDLDDLNDSGDTFGAKMVRWSIERGSSPRAEASRINGSHGGRPQNVKKEFNPYQRLNPPESREDVFNFAKDNSIPDWCAIEFYEMNSSRDWKDRDGKTIYNWKGALVKYHKSKKETDK